MKLELLLKKLDEVLDSELRVKIGSALLAMGVVLLLTSLGLKSQSVTVASPEQSLGPDTFQQVWFDQEGVLYGSNQHAGTLRVERLTGGSGESAWEFSVPDQLPPRAWNVARSPGHDPWAAYLEAGQIHLLRSGHLDRTIDLTGFADPVLVTFLPGDLLGIVFRDGNTAWWDPVSLLYRNQQRLPVSEVGQSAAREGYLAVEDLRRRQIQMFRFLPDEGWLPNQHIPSPDRSFQLLVPSAGTVATLQGSILQINGKTVYAPGKVTSAVMRGGQILAAGDFASVVAINVEDTANNGDIEDQGEPQVQPLEGTSGDALAAMGDQVAVSGPQGTSIYQIRTGAHRSLPAQVIQLFGFLTIFAGAILILAPLLIMTTLAFLLRAQEEREPMKDLPARIPAKLPEPTPDMIKAAGSGHAVLWAGAGLSAQSGLMTRSQCVAGVIRTAEIENWVERADVEKLQQMVDQHRTELAMDQLLAMAPTARSEAASQVRSTIPSFCKISPAHKLLTRIPFAAAITTNYDDLLERSGFPWSSAVFHLRTLESANLEHGFLLKLYGSLNDSRVAVAHRDLKPLVQRSGFAPMAMEIFATRPVIFIGASLEGLLADLELLDVPKFAGRHHFAVTGSASPAWREQSARLEEDYGITVIACQEANIAEELPGFLLRLAMSVREGLDPVPEPEGVRV